MFSDLNRLLHHRYGPQLPDDDAGRDDAFSAVNLLIVRADGKMRARNWVRRRAPWYADELEEKIDKLIAHPYRFKADTLGRKLGLTIAERDQLKITTIRAIDFTKAQMDERRRERKRLTVEPEPCGRLRSATPFTIAARSEPEGSSPSRAARIFAAAKSVPRLRVVQQRPVESRSLLATVKRAAIRKHPPHHARLSKNLHREYVHGLEKVGCV
jgi:hypothetical protein